MFRNKLLIILLFTGAIANAQVNIVNLRCEMMVNPEGVGTNTPRFSWQLESTQRDVSQMSYQLLISESDKKIKNNEGDTWNSGWINDVRAVLMPFKGDQLKPGKKYYWKVRVLTNKGEANLKDAAFFSTGINEWSGKWIGYDKASAWDSITQWSRLSARYLRKEFTSNAPIKRATMYICGLGMYELRINQSKIGNQVLAPNPTDYRKTVLYNTFDVTSNLQQGENAIAVVLGNGRFFTMRQNYKTQKHNTFGYPKLLLQLDIEYANGTKKTIVSDQTWKLNVDGPIRTNNEYDGEEYDATKEFAGWDKAGFKDGSWLKPELVASPSGQITAQYSEPMKVMQTIKPVSIKKIGDKYILDMGQNFAGWIKMAAKGEKGRKIKLRFAESLQSNGELFTANLRDAKVTDVYTLKGAAITEVWQPSFVYHGFRYVEISGYPGTPALEDFEGKLVYDALETTGYFQTSNATINAIYKNAWWGIASNYKGMPVDCPQRNERQPWLGDRAVGAQGEMYLFDNAKLYAKWMADINQSQTEQGAIPDVAPAFWNYYSDNVTWPATYITVTGNLYNQYGDKRPIETNYASMRKWMMYMKEKYLVDYIMTKDKYGDWCVPPESLNLIHAKDSSRITDGKLIASAYYYRLLGYMERFARLLDKADDAKEYASLANNMRTTFQAKFYNPQQQYYSNNTITANLLPLYFGICPDSLRDKVFEKIYHKIHVENGDHTSTGLIGIQFLMRGLTEYGQTDLAYTLASTNTYPSWGYMVANGATTIWELWNGNTADPNMNSQNHVMLLGDLLTWFYENLGGIRTHKTDVAFKKINFKPTFPTGLDFVNASYKSPYGLIKSSWKKDAAKLEWSVTVPANSTGTVYIPCHSIEEVTESGVALSASGGIQKFKYENGVAVIDVSSGTYSFKTNLK